jgi:putative ABC transport system permease protein
LNILQAVRVSAGALWTNKLRAALTMLGVIIGVFAVVTLVSIAQGATGTVTDQVRQMGSNLITLNITGRGQNSNLTLNEVALLTGRQGIEAVTAVISQRVAVKWENQTVNTTLEGTTPSYTTVRNHDIDNGRFLQESDIEYRQNVVVLGSTVANELFGQTGPLGREVRIDGTPFTVIGVLTEKGTGIGGSSDEKIVIPVTTALRFLKSRGVTSVYVQAESPEAVPRVVAALEASLYYHFRDENAFRVFSQTQLLESMSQITTTLTLMLGGIAGISLIVGGIGIMNIMLVSVTERTREIGVCKALGAKRRDILGQFLIESAFLSGFGGIIGMILGFFTVRAISAFSGINAVFSAPVVALALIFSLFVGIFFGIYPAAKASRLNPIDALRA